MNKQLEALSTDENKYKLFNILPLRTRIIPNYITFDTASIINLLIEENSRKYLSNIKDTQKEIWDKFFYTNTFKKNKYRFNYMIKSDGIGVSILFVRIDDKGNLVKVSKKQLMDMEKQREIDDKQYIENQLNIKEILNSKNYICIDPNKDDIIYCMDKDNNKFRYTQNQRRLETRNKKYIKILDQISKTTKINNKSIKEIETELSNYNSKTCNFEKFIEYLKMKNKVNSILYEQYKTKIYRKLKWNRFINTQKSESKMINNFRNKYGTPENNVIILGDYDKGSHNMKNKEPIINKRIRKIFRANQYKIYLISEFRTSKLCSCCNNEVENFLIRPSNKPKNKGRNELVWGLVCCKNKKCCQETKYNSRIFNRDMNATLNMINIVKSLIKTNKIPDIFTRKKED